MKILAISAFLCFAGCSALLPRGNTVSNGPWDSYASAEQTFDKIIPYQTSVDDLKGLGLDLRSTPNITILNYSEVLRRFVPSPSINADDLDSGVRECISAKDACKGYEIDQRTIKKIRSGNFWADWLNFKRRVDVKGWHFRGILLIRDNLVIYKLVGGQPLIHEVERNDNPLGPLQGSGDSTVRSLLF